MARDGGRYAVYVDDPNTDPVVAAMAVTDGTCELLIPRDRYDPLEVLAVLEEWEREPGARESVRSHKRDSVGGWQSGDSA
ncbi:MAG: hypothetical protein ACREXU_18725, partial [Gammaproteobacteria bacterium]